MTCKPCEAHSWLSPASLIRKILREAIPQPFWKARGFRAAVVARRGTAHQAQAIPAAAAAELPVADLAAPEAAQAWGSGPGGGGNQ